MSNEEEIEIIDDVESSVEVNNTNDNITEPNTISNNVIEEKKEESINNEVIEDKKDETTPVMDNSKDEAFNVIMNEVPSPQDTLENKDDNNQSEDNNNVNNNIVPNNNVEPQEVVSEPVVDNVVDKVDSNNEVVIDNSIEEVPKPLNQQPEQENNINNNDVINIKETSTLKNEAGTAVIGEINGDNVTAINSVMPTSIDVNAKNNQVEVNNKKKVKIKTKNQKISSIIIVILVLLIIGTAGYFGYSYFINNRVTFEVKNLSLEYGEEIPNSASYYIVSSKPVDDMEYSLDISNVGVDVGDYDYSVTYKGNTKTGTITIIDSKGPVVVFKDNLMFPKNTEITKEMLVSSCDDGETCTYELGSSIDSSVAGNQEVVIIAKDENGNTTEAKTNISIIGKTLTCKNADTVSEDGTYSERLEDVFYFDDQDNFVSSVGKKVVTFIDYGSYFALLNNEETKDKYNFDRKTFSYWVKNDILYKDGTSLSVIKDFYNNNGYTCE